MESNLDGVPDFLFLFGEGLLVEDRAALFRVPGAAGFGGVGLGVVAVLVVVFSVLILEEIEGFVHEIVTMNYKTIIGTPLPPTSL